MAASTRTAWKSNVPAKEKVGKGPLFQRGQLRLSGSTYDRHIAVAKRSL
jgi:hypothetical protein